MSTVKIERCINRKPTAIPETQTGYQCGNYFGFETPDLRRQFMAHYDSNTRVGVDQFDQYDKDGTYWCVWRSGCDEPTGHALERQGYTLQYI